MLPYRAIEAVAVTPKENPDLIFLLPSATLLLGLGVCGQSALKVCAPNLTFTIRLRSTLYQVLP
jgi:hypothetical protein